MSYKFLGVLPNSPGDESPTVWLHEPSGDLLIQSYKATDEEVQGCQKAGSVPGHSTDVPGHETIIRLPKEMLRFIPRIEGEGEANSDDA
ncbi:hypothetical protein ACFV0R_15740 [Streptomyces sp. NPDC059578]|uniref:hypothetical protein n=1 Tax=Streptomyces sp. NPDC059578 TaxID=3346874 RepID=UPI0036A6956E